MELLVVIGIIAVLISMLLPALQKARFSAKVTACGSNQRQIYAALVMYANDNNGFLPGSAINVMDFNRAAVYAGATARYPWEPDSYKHPDPRWFGIGQLMEGKYLPPNRVVTCTDFYTTRSNSFEKLDGFELPEKYEAMVMGGYAYIEGSYVLNTIPYYDLGDSAAVASNRSRGKIGKPGRNGGWHSPGPAVPHITAYIMCLSGIQLGAAGHSDLGPTITHERKGVNVTYIDGHVAYLPIPDSVWRSLLYSNSFVSTGGDNRGNRGFWPWASLME